jgi:hypothetical protein
MADEIIKLDENVEVETSTENFVESAIAGLDQNTETATPPAIAAIEPTAPVSAFVMLDEMLQKSPAFQQYVANRAAAMKPIVSRRPAQRARDWDLSFGPVFGRAGTITTMSVQPRCFFRGEKIIAIDSSERPGYGTRIMNIFVGQQRQQLPTEFLTSNLSSESLRNGAKLDTCNPALSIAATISFIESCTFSMSIFGKAIL